MTQFYSFPRTESLSQGSFLAPKDEWHILRKGIISLLLARTDPTARARVLYIYECIYVEFKLLLGRSEIWSVSDDRIRGTLNAHCSKRSEKETDSV